MVERIIKGSLNGYFYEGNRELNIIVLGGSKGAELSLLLSTLYEEIKGVVVFTPSFYCFQGVNPMKKVSSWMFRGEEIPYVKYRLFSKSGFTLLKDMLLKKKLVLRDMYADAIKYARNREEARIKIEKTQAKYLMFAGDDDKMW